jgi:alpha-tubulin suppressor-like RCC1 family protein
MKIVKVACSDSLTVALTEDGYVYTWGTFRVRKTKSRQRKKEEGPVLSLSSHQEHDKFINASLHPVQSSI